MPVNGWVWAIPSCNVSCEWARCARTVVCISSSVIQWSFIIQQIWSEHNLFSFSCAPCQIIDNFGPSTKLLFTSHRYGLIWPNKLRSSSIFNFHASDFHRLEALKIRLHYRYKVWWMGPSRHIRRHNSFLMDTGDGLEWMSTECAVNTFDIYSKRIRFGTDTSADMHDLKKSVFAVNTHYTLRFNKAQNSAMNEHKWIAMNDCHNHVHTGSNSSTRPNHCSDGSGEWVDSQCKIAGGREKKQLNIYWQRGSEETEMPRGWTVGVCTHTRTHKLSKYKNFDVRTQNNMLCMLLAIWLKR